MATSRLAGITPPEGEILLIGPRAAEDLSAFDRARTRIVQPQRADFDSLSAQGWRVVTDDSGAAAAAVVFLPRARAQAQARIAAAAAALAEGASLWVDGQKTDGIDAILREMRNLAPVDEVLSRGHGKIFRVTVPAGDWLPQEWTARDLTTADGFVTRAGVFSADGADPGSQMLAAALPDKLPTRIVDLGAGWGWLSAQILRHASVETLHLVESDHDALALARRNLSDPRAQFHWADATTFRLPEPVNGVIMNPPFHDGRAADPQIGARFIRTAAGLLTTAGRLWMVANRHLPYEMVLAEHFANHAEIAGDTRFKILTVTGARRAAAGNARRR